MINYTKKLEIKSKNKKNFKKLSKVINLIEINK